MTYLKNVAAQKIIYIDRSTSVDRTSRPVSLTCVQHHIETFFDENSGHGDQLSASYNGDDCSLSPIPNVVHSPRHGQHNRKNRNVRLKLPRRTIGEKENNNGSITVLVYMHSQKCVFFGPGASAASTASPLRCPSASQNLQCRQCVLPGVHQSPSFNKTVRHLGSQILYGYPTFWVYAGLNIPLSAS